MKHFSVRIADDASDKNADTVARRGRIAGKMIGTVQVEDDISHSCVLPDDIEAREVPAFVERDFLECTDTLSGNTDDIEDRRELAATKRSMRQRAEERKAARE